MTLPITYADAETIHASSDPEGGGGVNGWMAAINALTNGSMITAVTTTAVRDTTLLASTDFMVPAAVEVAAAGALEVPATSTLEVFTGLVDASSQQKLTGKTVTDTTIGAGFDALTTQRDTTLLGGADFLTGAYLVEIQASHVLEIPATSSLEVPFVASGTVVNPTITGYIETAQALGVVATGTVVLGLAAGTIINATLTASTTTPFIMPPAVTGQSFVLLLKQPAVTGGGVGTFSPVKWSAAGAPTITTTAGAADLLTFICPDGINWYGSYSQGYSY